MAESAQSRTSRGLPKRSMTFDADVLRYLEAYAKQVDRPVAYVVREILRAWMDARIATAAVSEQTRSLESGAYVGEGGK